MAGNSNLNSSRQKPLLYGDGVLDAKALEDIATFEDQGFDYSYVPGYSEQRRMNEHAVRDGLKPMTLDRLYWARAARPDGSNVDYREAVTVSRLGYRACTLEDLRERGWGMPPAAHVAADGSIRREDTVLAIVDSDRARKNQRRQQEATAAFEGRNDSPDLPGGESTFEKQGRSVSLQDAKNALLGN